MFWMFARPFVRLLGGVSRRKAAKAERKEVLRAEIERRIRDKTGYWNSGETIVDRFGR